MRLKYLIPLIIFLALAAFLFVGLYLDPRKVPSALIDKPAPEFDLPMLSEPERHLSKKDLLGRVYLVNVWASWCEACRYEHPFFVRLKRAGNRVTLVGYNYRDKRPAALRWLSALGDPYDYSLADEDGRAALDWGVYGAPETFVVDRQGVIRHKVIGAVTQEVWDRELSPLLTKLEKQP